MEVAQDLTQYQVWISVMLTHHSWGELRVTLCNQDDHSHVKEVWCSLPSLFMADIEGTDKIMATVVKATCFFIYMELGHCLLAIQLVSLE